jgi:hypothetical protein
MRAVLVALVLTCLAGARAACQGNACKEQQEAARAGGLLGASSSGSASNGCTPKQYPATGTLLPASAAAAAACQHSA